MRKAAAEMSLLFQDHIKLDSINLQISTQALDKAQIIPYNGNELVNQEIYSNDEDETNSGDDDSKDHFDVVFLIDEMSYTDTQLNEIKKEIQAVSEIIFKHSKDVTISIYGLDGSGLTHSTWYGRADNITNVGIMLSHVSHKEIANRYNQVALSECIDYVIAAHKISSESAKRPEYGFVYYDPYYLNSDSELVFRFLADSPRTDEYGMKMLELVKSEGTDIDFSTVTASYAEIIGSKSYANNLSEVTNGTFINGTSYTSVVNESIEHIYGKALEEVNVYKLLIATNFEYVNLKKPINEKYIENAIKYGHNYIDISEFDEEDIEDCADTDGDGLWDFQEIKVFKGLTETPENQIIWFEDGKLMLPTVNDMTKEVYKDIYSSEEIDAFREYFAEQYGHNIDSEFWNTPVLPINSDPDNPDGDGDGIPDKLDSKALAYDILPDLFKYYINEGVMWHSDIVIIHNNFYICNNVSALALKLLPNECELADIDNTDVVSIYSLLYNNEYIYGASKKKITQLSGSLLSALYASMELMDYYKVKENDQIFNVSGWGITFCLSSPGINITGSINYIFDYNGNSRIQLSSGGGVGIGAGGSITLNSFDAKVDDISDMDGFGASVGASVGLEFAVGADLLFMPIDMNNDGDYSDDADKCYWGISGSVGLGSGVEGHVNGSYAQTKISWNNYDLIKKALEYFVNGVVS